MLNNCIDNFRKLLRKSELENINYRRLKWILYKQYHRLTDKELDELHLCFEDCQMLKGIYWTREKFHHILDNGKQVEVVVQEMEKWGENMTKEVKSIFKPFIKI